MKSSSGCVEKRTGNVRSIDLVPAEGVQVHAKVLDINLSVRRVGSVCSSEHLCGSPLSERKPVDNSSVHQVQQHWEAEETYTASTHTNACGAFALTASQIPFTSCIVPRMLDTCVNATSRVFSLTSAATTSGVSLGPRSSAMSSLDGRAHLTTSFCRSARSSHDATLASWSTAERTTSSPSWKRKVADALRKSWVVEAPRTVEKRQNMVSLTSHSFPVQAM